MHAVEEIFGALGDVDRVEGRGLTTDQVAGYDVLLVRSVSRIDDELLDDLPLQFVGSATSGFDHVDREALERRNIPFAHAPGSNADSVVDYVLSAIAHCPGKLETLLAGDGEVGIVGYGHVGGRLRERLLGLGIKSRAYDPWLDVSGLPELTSLEEVLDCAVICLHAELTQRQPWPSFHLLNAETLNSVRGDALLINAGRGELLDTDALLRWLPGVPEIELVLDVWEGEPEIRKELLPYCRYTTPHIAGYSHDGKLKATRMLFQALCDCLGLEAGAEESEVEPVAVAVPAALEAASLLRYLVLQVYDIREDDKHFRLAPERFDQLRKQYPQRRELAAVHVSDSEFMTDQARALCRAAGCRLG
jgi:erythronate-4-phosphate dehydrogenase